MLCVFHVIDVCVPLTYVYIYVVSVFNNRVFPTFLVCLNYVHVGIDFKLKTLTVGGKRVRMQIW